MGFQLTLMCLGTIGLLNPHVQNALCLSVTDLFPLAHDEWLCVEDSFSSCTSIGLLRWFALGWSCPVLFLYTNCSSIFCWDVLSSLPRPGVRQSRQDRLKSLVKVCLSTNCTSPGGGHLLSACCQHCLLSASILPKCSSWKAHPVHSFPKEVLNEGGGWPCQLL